MKLYLLHRCPFAHRASIALGEKQLPFELVFFTAGQRPPELGAIGPYAKSPTLFDGDAKVWDSQIVLEYLDEKYPARPLMPSGASARAEARMLQSRVSTELMSKLGTIVAELIYKPEAQRDLAKVDAAKREFLAALPAWDHQLEGRQFLVGDALSFADITLYTVFPAIHQIAGLEVPADQVQLRGWLDRMAARPTTKLPAP